MKILRFLIGLILTTALFDSLLGLETAVYAQGIKLSETRPDQPGFDGDEYFELAGPPGASLDGLTYIVIGDAPIPEPPHQSGVIETIVPLTGYTIPLNRPYFLVAENSFSLTNTVDLTTTLDFENNDNYTHLLVSGFTGFIGQDLDTNEDCLLDDMGTLPWTAVVDGIAMRHKLPGFPSNCVYHTQLNLSVIGPIVGNVPGHVWQCTSGWSGTNKNWTPGPNDTPGAPANSCNNPTAVTLRTAKIAPNKKANPLPFLAGLALALSLTFILPSKRRNT